MGDEELGQVVIEGFLGEMPDRIEALRSCLAAGDAAGSLREVHTIKGASANVGGEALRAVALAAEQAGQGGNLAVIITRVPEIELQFALLKEAMLGVAGPEGAAPGERS
jgi:HPt (histidine-containing phosphotransfer) domain-containing protein